MDTEGKNQSLDHVIQAITTMDSDMLEKVNIYIAGIETGKNIANTKYTSPVKEKNNDIPT